MRGDQGKEAENLPALAEGKAAFEHRDGLVEVPFAEVQVADTPRREDTAVEMISRLSNMDSFFAERHALGECATLGKDHTQEGAAGHGGQTGYAKVLIAPVAFEGGQVPAKAFHGLRQVASRPRGHAQARGCPDLEGEIPAGPGGREGALVSRNGAVMITHHSEIPAHIDGDLP